MFDMTDVAMADMLAGGPRADLDDVVLGDERVAVSPTAYPHVPAGVPLLEYLRGVTEEHETVETFKRFYENPEDVDWDVIAEDIQELRRRSDREGPRTVTRMYLNYGADLYERCPWLTMRDVWLHLCELGFDHSEWAVYRFFNRQGLSNTARSRHASVLAARKREAQK